MDAFTKGDCTCNTDHGTATVHVPATICASQLAHAAAKLVAAKAEATEPKAA